LVHFFTTQSLQQVFLLCQYLTSIVRIVVMPIVLPLAGAGAAVGG
jgi:hypothetical protein